MRADFSSKTAFSHEKAERDEKCAFKLLLSIEIKVQRTASSDTVVVVLNRGETGRSPTAVLYHH